QLRDMIPFLLTLLLSPPFAPPSPLHLDGRAFDQPVTIDVRDLPPDAAREVASAALREIAVLERETDPEPPAGTSPIAGTLAALNAAAGKGPQAVRPPLLPILSRAPRHCPL